VEDNMIVQVDSINRIANIDQCDLVILDEYESILSQMNSGTTESMINGFFGALK
jgi:hypothetical protein